MYDNLTCPLKCGEVDTLPNLLSCKVLKDRLQTDIVTNNTISYNDVYSSDVVKQKEVTELYTHLLKIREDLLNSTPPVALTGPMH